MRLEREKKAAEERAERLAAGRTPGECPAHVPACPLQPAPATRAGTACRGVLPGPTGAPPAACCSLLPAYLAAGGAGGEEDINSQLGVGSVAADAELDAMKEQVGEGCMPWEGIEDGPAGAQPEV